MCQYVCLIHFLGQTDKTSSMPMFVSRKYKIVWYPSNQSLKKSLCVGPQKCITIIYEVCLHWFGHNSMEFLEKILLLGIRELKNYSFLEISCLICDVLKNLETENVAFYIS